MRITVVTSTTIPRITGRSRRASESKRSGPIPGSPKARSTKIAPLKAIPMSIPSIVTIGSIAFRSTCVCRILHSPIPKARAVRTCSASIVSMMLARIIRA